VLLSEISNDESFSADRPLNRRVWREGAKAMQTVSVNHYFSGGQSGRPDLGLICLRLAGQSKADAGGNFWVKERKKIGLFYYTLLLLLGNKNKNARMRRYIRKKIIGVNSLRDSDFSPWRLRTTPFPWNGP
jgi:hypothetical protein